MVELAEGGVGAEAVAGVLLILAEVIVCIGGAVFGRAARGVFGVALYRYVAEDRTLAPFTTADLDSAARTRKPTDRPPQTTGAP